MTNSNSRPDGGWMLTWRRSLCGPEVRGWSFPRRWRASCGRHGIWSAWLFGVGRGSSHRRTPCRNKSTRPSQTASFSSPSPPPQGDLLTYDRTVDVDLMRREQNWIRVFGSRRTQKKGSAIIVDGKLRGCTRGKMHAVYRLRLKGERKEGADEKMGSSPKKNIAYIFKFFTFKN